MRPCSPALERELQESAMHQPIRFVLVSIVVMVTTLAVAQSLTLNANYLFGGSGEDRIAAIATDANGNVWIAGSTKSSDLPGVDAAREMHVPDNDSDGFVAKFAPGGELLFAHYLGGSADDEARGIAINANGDAFVVGTSSSLDFPNYEMARRAFITYVSSDGKVMQSQRLPAGAANAITAYRDGEFWVVGETETVASPWVAKVRSGYVETATALKVGTPIGRALALAVDASGNCYVTGEMSSPDLQTTPDAVQPDLAGSKDAFFVKLLSDGTLVYSTYFGDSSGETSGRAIILDDSRIYIAGATTASVLPMATSSAPFGTNAFVAQFTDTTLLSSRFLGGSGTDEGNGIAIDDSSYPVVVGRTDSQDFLSSPFCSYSPCFDAFALTLDTPGIAARIGGQGISEAASITKDAFRNLLVAGMTDSPIWPVTDGARRQHVQGRDGFFMRFAIEPDPPIVYCNPPATRTWSAVDVEVTCEARDYGTGLANFNDSTFILKTSVDADTETNAAETDSRRVCDHSGNCFTAGPYKGFQIDKKAPAITIMLKASYTLKEVAPADYACDDRGGSGVKSCVGPVPAGATLDTSTPGKKTFTIIANDDVGNEATQSFT
jgi:hypothetical protein